MISNLTTIACARSCLYSSKTHPTHHHATQTNSYPLSFLSRYFCLGKRNAFQRVSDLKRQRLQPRMDEEMDLKTFLANRKKREEAASFRGICSRCFRPVKTCLCSTIQPFDTETRFVILMHPKEAKKTRMGTGRLAHLFSNNSEIVVGLDFSADSRVNSLIADSRYRPFVLYPGENSVDLSEHYFLFHKIADKRLLVFVIDASWPLAKKILKLSSNLQALPQICFRPEAPSRYTKKQPHENCLCTLESVCFLLEELEKAGLEDCRGKNSAMLAALDEMSRIQSEHIRANSPGGHGVQDYRRHKNTWPPGKRQRRSVCFDDEEGVRSRQVKR